MTDAPRQVDPWRFTGTFLKGVLSARIPETPSHPPIPWAEVRKPVAASKVALLTTAGISSRDDTPFDMDGERAKPMWGDPSWRRIPAGATSATVCANHLHIDTGYIERDLNVALPLDRLRELEEEGAIGAVAGTHYSIMGYQGSDSSVLENESGPAIAEAMKSDEVDLALLAPV